jgi:hypothetical protein
MTSALEELLTFARELVYPGHPICLAYLIMRLYPDYDTARKREDGETYCNALRDARIPGAGGNIWAAMDVLKRAKVVNPESALLYGESYWLTGRAAQEDDTDFRKGVEQANAITPQFLALVREWVWPQEPATS